MNGHHCQLRDGHRPTTLTNTPIFFTTTNVYVALTAAHDDQQWPMQDQCPPLTHESLGRMDEDCNSSRSIRYVMFQIKIKDFVSEKKKNSICYRMQIQTITGLIAAITIMQYTYTFPPILGMMYLRCIHFLNDTLALSKLKLLLSPIPLHE